MEVFVMVLLAGVAGYCFFKHCTKRGGNSVRAYLYLRAIIGGVSVEQANQQIAQTDIVSLPTHIIRNAQDHVRIVYDGKQLSMIADAVRQGLVLR